MIPADAQAAANVSVQVIYKKRKNVILILIPNGNTLTCLIRTEEMLQIRSSEILLKSVLFN